MSVLSYGIETMIWREKERSRIRAVQMDNLRGLLGIRRIDSVLSARFRELCAVAKKWKEGLTEAFSDGLAILKGFRMIGLLKGICGRV